MGQHDDEKKLSRLISLIYEASLNPMGWRTLPMDVAGFIGVESSMLHLRNLTSGKVLFLGKTANFTDALQEQYEVFYHKEDLWVQSACTLGVNKLFVGHRHLPTATLIQTPFYNDYLIQMEMADVVGAAIQVETGIIASFGIHRAPGTAEFTSRQEQLTALLLPHIQRALQIQCRLDQAEVQKGIVLGALDRIAGGVILVDGRGKLLLANTRAESVLSQGDIMAVRHGILRMTNPATDSQLHRMIAEIVKIRLGRLGSSGGLVLAPRVDKRPLELLLCPCDPHAWSILSHSPAVLIFIHDPDWKKQPPLNAIIAFYGLTSAESALIKALGTGERPETYANRKNLSLHTVRTQLKSIRQKTDKTRNMDLLLDIAANPLLAMMPEAED